MVGARRRAKLREHQYREGYTRSLEEKGVEWDGDNNVEHTWEQVKRAMVEGAREMYDLVRGGGKNPKSVLWTNEIKAAVRRKEATWKEVLVASDEDAKERCMEAYRKKEEKG